MDGVSVKSHGDRVAGKEGECKDLYTYEGYLEVTAIPVGGSKSQPRYLLRVLKIRFCECVRYGGMGDLYVV